MESPSSARLINTSTFNDATSAFQTTTIIADIKVSETKISHLYIPSKTVVAGGFDNIIQTAVREAIQAAGEYDVLVAKETQVKYADSGQVESVLVTGYPGKYVNWRSTKEPAPQSSTNPGETSGMPLPFVKGK